jgi:hydroxymethylpyrimidine/phosphomethylpyrimidine kinase
MTSARTAIALTIAGSDSSGGAGIQADLKTFSALGVYGASVLTALTAQNTRGVQGVQAVPAAFIAAQIDSVLTDLDVGAIKTGMLATAVIVETVANALANVPRIPLVADPVMVATSGDLLLEPTAVEAVRRRLVPRATLITPNLPEAARLLDGPVALSESEMGEQARRLLQLGCGAVMLKGGHGQGATALDLLVTRTQTVRIERPRLDATNTHGTGCTLAAAIAAFLAQGRPLREAAERAKAFVWEAIKAGQDLGVGQGRGPVDHLYAIRRQAPPV